MARVAAALAICALFGFGFVRLWRQRARLEGRSEFALEYLTRLQAYIGSGGEDSDAYTWLTHRANKMQGDMGTAGILEGYRPPFAQYMLRNYPIVLNMLPELRNASPGGGRDLSGLFDQYAAALQEALIRHQGLLADHIDRASEQLANPIIWLREGVQLLLLLPLAVLTSLGVGSASVATRVAASLIFRILSAIVAIVTFLASVVTILAGAEAAQNVVNTLLQR